MPGTYWHHDDFLFEVQYPPTNEESKEPPVKAGDELLERFLRRLRRTGFNLTLSASVSRPKLCVNRFGKTFWANLSPPSS